jgi:thioredoxin reductase (NADPH)
MEKIVIAGSGPAGLTAALYAARADLKPVVVEGPSPGGQLTLSAEVENYPGFPQGISGSELILLMRQQAERFGTRFVSGEIASVDRVGETFRVRLDGETLDTQTLVIATGAEARRLGIASEPKFYGRGVSGCATCDGAFYRNKEVLVVGGGNTAIDDALFLTKFAKRVTILHRRDYFRAAHIGLQKAREHAKIAWIVPGVIEEIQGEKFVQAAIVRNPTTGETQRVACDGIFVAIGHEPKTAMFEGLVDLDEQGFIKGDPTSTRTSTPGVFACGDVRDPVYKQAVLAAGQGCMAALDVERYLGQKE